MLDRGYEATTFAGLLDIAPGRNKYLAVTFDDAYLSVYEHAFPVLRELGVPATVFVPTQYIDANQEMSWPGIDHWGETEWHAETRGASWDQLRELAAAGWEIASHTRSHPKLTQLDSASLARELTDARLDCEREIGRPCRTIAYPYGDFDDRVAEAASAAGYEAGAALAARSDPVAWNPMQIPRVAVYQGDSDRRIAFKAELLLRFPRIWNLLLGVRAMAGRLRG